MAGMPVAGPAVWDPGAEPVRVQVGPVPVVDPCVDVHNVPVTFEFTFTFTVLFHRVGGGVS